MGYSAFVPCNCYKEGKANPFPLGIALELDEDGYYTDTSIREKYYSTTYAKIDNAIYEWVETACEHENMRVCYENLANVFSFSEFREQIYELNPQYHLPILTKFLPKTNDGCLPAQFVPQVLKELETLENLSPISDFYLIEKNTNHTITANFLTITQEYSLGIDRKGTYIDKKVDKTHYIRVFSSRHFTQRKINNNNYEFVDIKTQKKGIFSVSVLDFANTQIDKLYEFYLISEKISFYDKFDFIIESLKKLCQASLATGNAIYWT